MLINLSLVKSFKQFYELEILSCLWPVLIHNLLCSNNKEEIMMLLFEVLDKNNIHTLEWIFHTHHIFEEISKFNESHLLQFNCLYFWLPILVKANEWLNFQHWYLLMEVHEALINSNLIQWINLLHPHCIYEFKHWMEVEFIPHLECLLL